MYKKIRADYIFTGKAILDNTNVLVIDDKGCVQDIVTTATAGDDIQYYEGLLTPGFINTHCHLELSALKGYIAEHTGLVNFVTHIMQQRNTIPNEKILQAITNAESEMISNGIVAVGDIANTSITLLQKQKQFLHYENFIEISGFDPTMAAQRFAAAQQVYASFQKKFPTTTIVPHAPYSVSKKLFELIHNFSIQRIATIHNQESADENIFFTKGQGAFNALYKQMNIPIADFFSPTGKSSLQTYLPWMKQQTILLVHNTFTQQAAIDFVKMQTRANAQTFYFCLCPNANLYIENTMPPIDLLQKNNCNIVLGTDSLASNHQLNILEEIKTIATHHPNISLCELLQWGTINGANALHIGTQYGSFEKGKTPSVVVINGLDKNGNITTQSQATTIK